MIHLLASWAASCSQQFKQLPNTGGQRRPLGGPLFPKQGLLPPTWPSGSPSVLATCFVAMKKILTKETSGRKDLFWLTDGRDSLILVGESKLQEHGQFDVAGHQQSGGKGL